MFLAFFFCVWGQLRIKWSWILEQPSFLIGIIWDTLVHLVASAPFCSEMCFPFFDSEILIVFSLEFVAYILMNDDYFGKILIFDALIIDASKAPSDKSCFTIKQPTCNKILAKNFYFLPFSSFRSFPGMLRW